MKWTTVDDIITAIISPILMIFCILVAYGSITLDYHWFHNTLSILMAVGAIHWVRSHYRHLMKKYGKKQS